MIIYISGPMSGLPEMNFPAFAEAADRLRDEGRNIISPHEVELPQYPKGFNPKNYEEKIMMWKAFMRADIIELMRADMVAVLPNWENSRGSLIEVKLAYDLGMPIVDAENLRLIDVSRWGA